MKKIFKQSLSLVLSVSMALTAPLSTLAAETSETADAETAIEEVNPDEEVAQAFEGYDMDVPMDDSLATPVDEDGVIQTVHLTMENVVTEKIMAVDVPWSDDWLPADSTIYNNQLATLSCALSDVAYGYNYTKDKETDDLVFENLQNMGFAYEDIQAHYNIDYKTNGIDQVAYAFAYKTIKQNGQDIPMVYVLIRGTNSNYEWQSNMNIDNKTEGTDNILAHEGFNVAAATVEKDMTEFFKTYIPEQDMGNAKILVLGHSRGAAVANLVGASIDDDIDAKRSDLTKKNVFVYTFATPTTIESDSNINQANYTNIFNILNPEDLVKDVPFSTYPWNFIRYGVNKCLPSKSTTAKAYKNLREKMNVYYSKLSGRSYVPFNQGTMLSKVVRIALPNVIRSVAWYYAKVFGWSVHGYLVSQFNPEGNKISYIDGFIKLLKVPFISSILQIKKYATQAFTDMHAVETYYSWLCVANDGIDIFSSTGGRMMIINGTTDLEAVDPEGNIICKVENGVIKEEYTTFGLPIIITDEDSEYSIEDGELVPTDEAVTEHMTYIQIPDGYDCTITLKDSADPDLDVIVSDYDEDTEIGDSIYFNDIEMPVGTSMSLDFTEGMTLNSLELKDHTDAPIDATSKVNKDDQNTIDITVHIEGEGDVGKQGLLDALTNFVKAKDGEGLYFGTEKANIGDTVTLTAIPAEDSAFEGWYKDNQKVSDDENYTFQVDGPTELTLKFTQPSTVSQLFS